MDLLVELARRPGKVVRKERLLRRVWGDSFVTEGVLKHAVWELRRALGDSVAKPRFIETVPRRGYRLAARVSRVLKAPHRPRLEVRMSTNSRRVFSAGALSNG